MGPPYARQYLLNFARLIITTGLTIGLFGAAVILLAGRLPGLLGKFLFVIAALSPVLICVWGFEKKPLQAVGLTARRIDIGYFFFGMLWAAAWMVVVLWLVGLSTGRNDFLSPYARVRTVPGLSIICYWASVKSCFSADTCFRTCSASGPFGGGACSPRRLCWCSTAWAPMKKMLCYSLLFCSAF